MKDYLQDLWAFKKAFIYLSIILGFVNWVFSSDVRLVSCIIGSLISTIILFTIIYLLDRFGWLDKIAKFLLK
jgi:hypothetical protein